MGLLGVFATIIASGACAQQTDIPKNTDEAVRVYEQLVERYAAFQAYQDTGALKYDIQIDGDDSMFGGMNSWPDQPMSFSLDRPGKFLLKLGGQIGTTLQSDGSQMWIVSDTAEQYIEVDRPEQIDLQALSVKYPTAQFTSHPVAGILLNEMRVKSPTTPVGVKPEERNGVMGQRLYLHMRYTEDSMPGWGDVDLPGTMWIGSDGLIHEFTIDYTDAYNDMMAEYGGGGGDTDPNDRFAGDAPEEDTDAFDFGGFEMPTYKKMAYTFVIDNPTITPDFAPNIFAFEAPSGYEKVDEISMPWDDMDFDFDATSQQDLALTLVGNEAPAWTCETLEGGELSLADLRGSVVVMDFWATWCGPCVAAMPHMQKLHEKYENEGVVFLGINQDFGNSEAVEKFLEKNKVTIRQVMDDGTIGTDYHVSGIPTLALVDKQGVVQHISVGFGGEAEAEELAHHIDAVLAGEQLFNNEDVVPIGHIDESAIVTSTPIENINPDSFTLDGKLRNVTSPSMPGMVGGQLIEHDVDGDGVKEFVGLSGTMPASKIAIVTPDGTDSRTISLKGMARQAMVQGLGVDGEGEHLRFLVSAMHTNMRNAENTLYMFDQNGEEVWSYSPDVDANAFSQLSFRLGDIDNDGKREVVVGIMVMDMRSYSNHSYVAIIDADAGDLLAMTSIGNVHVQGINLTEPDEHGTQMVLAVTDRGVERLAWKRP